MNSAEFVCSNADAALSWLESLGIQTRRGRFDVYRRTARTFLDRTTGKRSLTGKDTLALYDLDVLVRAYLERDKLLLLPETKATLYKMIGGAALYGEDTRRAPRDYQFELECQLELIRWGLSLVEPVGGDIEAHMVHVPFLIECKRPANFARLKQRIEDALDQIALRRFQGYRTVGLVMVDVTLICNPSHAHLRAQNEVEGIVQMRNYLRKTVVPKLGPFVQSLLVDPDTTGAFCRVLVPCWVQTFGWVQFNYWIGIETSSLTSKPDIREAGKMLQASVRTNADPNLIEG